MFRFPVFGWLQSRQQPSRASQPMDLLLATASHGLLRPNVTEKVPPGPSATRRNGRMTRPAAGGTKECC
jgi:hypothetical protein